MLMQVDLDGTTSREIAQLTQVDLDGTTIRELKELWQNDLAGVPRLIWASLAVTITPDALGAIGYSPGTISPSTPFASAIISGGLAPYSYAWSADGGFSVSNPTAATTKFVSPGLAPGDSASGTAYLTITDANGTTADATAPLNSYNTY